MTIYFDTSILIKLYVQEVNTPAALEVIKDIKNSIPFSHILEIELRTAIRLKYGQGEMTAAAMRSALQAMEQDLAGSVLVRPEYDLEAVYERSESLSSKYAASTLARSSDILHIAAALEAGCKGFASFDARQRKLAALAGLKLIPATCTAPSL